MTEHTAVDPIHAFAELGQIKFSETSLSDTLAHVSGVAKRTIPGADEVSVSLVEARGASTAAFTGELALHLDESQYELGMVRAWPRRPDYTPSAVADGAVSSLSVRHPLR